uniref:Heavy metal-associated isoprenylated plant protein 39-like n=1 Tax=Nelumbo nucifera TaxID=4432 RepID=A0A822XGN7_NELNU|nr:TPA_asm: hypothetical protein HUJ06_021003 [Nelumbo nucifera]
MKGVSSLSEKQLTVIGDVDPVDVVSKLRKLWHSDIVYIGPSKEPEKKEEPKKEEPKKEEPKKDPVEQQIQNLVKAYQAYNPHMTTLTTMSRVWKRTQMLVLFVNS